MFVSKDKEEKSKSREKKAKMEGGRKGGKERGKEGGKGVGNCVCMCVAPRPSRSALFIELRLLPVPGAAPSRLDRGGGGACLSL